MTNTKELYREQEKAKAVNQIKNGQIFNGDSGRKPYFLNKKWYPKADLLMDGKNNLFYRIKNEVVLYFALNNIVFHHLDGDSDKGFCIPSGHTLSSQISCLNYLFPLRYDKEAVLSIAKIVCSDFIDVLEIQTDSHLSGYIAFEVVSDSNHLNETNNLRGKLCTSIDALIYAQHRSGKRYLLPIEWKYTECYDDKDYSIENRPFEKEKEGKGKERLRRYCDSGLINNSKQLKSLDTYKSSIYFFEPFYQLMRQTLWAEQMVAYKDTETIKADEFIHVHVIPKENTNLLDKIYLRSSRNMETTWRECLQDQSKYKIISPKDLLANIDPNKYADLKNYLETRYW